MQGVYLTWMISALALGVLLLPVFKPKWMELRLSTFVDFFRRYWIHVLILFMIYNAKDGLDEIDRILMASTGLDMTPWIYAIEGDLVLHIQHKNGSKLLLATALQKKHGKAVPENDPVQAMEERSLPLIFLASVLI